MPPRAMGGTLPPEVLEDYKAQKKQKVHHGELKAMAKAKSEAEVKAKGKAESGQKNSEGLVVSVFSYSRESSPYTLSSLSPCSPGKAHALSSCLFPNLVEELLGERLWRPLPTLSVAKASSCLPTIDWGK